MVNVCVMVSGYKTYVVLDGTRGITKATVDTAIADMKQSGSCVTGTVDMQRRQRG